MLNVHLNPTCLRMQGVSVSFRVNNYRELLSFSHCITSAVVKENIHKTWIIKGCTNTFLVYINRIRHSIHTYTNTSITLAPAAQSSAATELDSAKPRLSSVPLSSISFSFLLSFPSIISYFFLQISAPVPLQLPSPFPFPFLSFPVQRRPPSPSPLSVASAGFSRDKGWLLLITGHDLPDV